MASFGGDWTEDKISRLDKYLRAYTRIFNANINAKYFRTVYMDAFAGKGYRLSQITAKSPSGLFSDITEEDLNFVKGSAMRALEVEPPFDNYIFIDKNSRSYNELLKLKDTYPDKADRIQVEKADANQFLKSWCANNDWAFTRAVLFLDPFGMQVDWLTLEQIAQTHAIDLWLLFPIGMGVNRLLTRNELPPKHWASRLTATLGTDQWQSEFYPPKIITTLFEMEETQSKNTDFDRISAYFVRRLETIFTGVAQNPLLLRNTKNVPLYLLCFATGAKKESAKKTALRIAQDILRR